MMEFGKIDDPVDASFKAWSDEPEGLGKKCADLALSFTGLVFLPATVAKILHDQFLPDSRFARIEYLFTAIRSKLKDLDAKTESRFQSLESQVEEVKSAKKSIQSKIETPQFEEAVRVACEESARATSVEKVDQFAQILVGSLTPTPWQGPPQDVATMVRDIAQLGPIDLLVLRELEIAFRNIGGSNFNLSNQYTENMQSLRNAITRSALHPDDFYSTCSRLSGFGLALEEVRNPSRMEFWERCFRPTHRGVMPMAYLKGANPS